MPNNQVTVSGNGYYTEDAEYVVSQQSGAWCYIVTRGDGSYTACDDLDAAHKLARDLASGDVDDSSVEWIDADA